MRTNCIILTLTLLGIAAMPINSSAANLTIGSDMALGSRAEISVTADGLDFELGRFSLLLAVNEQATAIQRVEPGTTLDECGYERFSYRYVADTLGEYDLGEFTRLVLVEGVLASPGASYPCATAGTTIELVRLHFLSTSDPSWEYREAPVAFYWRNCSDNAVYSRQGDTVQVVDSLYLKWVGEPVTGLLFPGFGVPDLACEAPAGVTMIRGMNGHWGGIEWGYSQCYTGDLNLNGVRYEISDLVLYGTYFQLGLFVFEPHIEGSIAQSDINCDGIVLTVRDFVALIRILSGDENPLVWKRSPAKSVAAEVTVTRDGYRTTFTLASAAGLGAGWLRFDAAAGAEVTVAGAASVTGRFKDQASVVIADVETLRPAMAPDETVVIHVTDPEAQLAYSELVDPSGEAVALKETAGLPNRFTLSQNYPNPFNPTTQIGFSLPSPVDWELTVFNLLGRQVESFAGYDQGTVTVTWEAGESASGVYFYQLQAGDFKETKRMVLLK